MYNIGSKAEKIYKIIFKEEPSSVVKFFIKNFGYVAIGSFFYIIFGFAFQILLGRIAGPGEYGKYVLLQSISVFLIIPMSFGIATALLKYNSESDDRARQSKIISTSYLLVLIFSLLSLILFSLFYKSISNLLGVSPVFFYLTAVYAFLSNFYILTTFTLRSLHKNKEFSFFQAFYGFISLAVLLFFLSISSISFYGAVFASYAAYFLVSIIIFIILRKYITFSFEKIWAVKVLSYGWYTTIATIASAITLNLDKVIINKYFTSGEVGLYGVYYNSFVLLASTAFNIFNTAFFPIASMHPQKEAILKKINKYILKLTVLGLFSIIVIGSLIFKIYGENYIFNIKIAILFSLISILYCVNSAYLWLMAATGKNGAKIVAINSTALAVLSTITNLILIPIFGIVGAAITSILSYLLSTLFIFLNKKQIITATNEARI